MGTVEEKLVYLNETKKQIGDAIKSKGVDVGPTDTFRSYAGKVSQIMTEPNLQEKSVTARENNTTLVVSADTGYDGLRQVEVHTAVPVPPIVTEEKTVKVTENGQTIVEKSPGVDGMVRVTVDTEVKPNLQEKSLPIITENGSHTVRPDSGYDGISQLGFEVNVPDAPAVTEEKNVEIVSNGVTVVEKSPGVDGMIRVTVNTDVKPNLREISISENGTFMPEGFDGYSKVSVNVQQGGGGNPFEAIGYEAADMGPVQRSVDYALEKMTEWDPASDSAMYLYEADKMLVFAPKIDTRNVVRMFAMYTKCSNLIFVPLLDTSKVEDMATMFKLCSSMISAPEFTDTHNVSTMGSMFEGCESLSFVPRYDTSNVTSVPWMFSKCTSLPEVPLLNIGKVEDMRSMFLDCSKLSSVHFEGGVRPSCNTSYFLEGAGSAVSGPKILYLHLPGDYSALLPNVPSDWTVEYVEG